MDCRGEPRKGSVREVFFSSFLHGEKESPAGDGLRRGTEEEQRARGIFLLLSPSIDRRLLKSTVPVSNPWSGLLI
ncbi:hypothetical protein BHM03_00005085 [Ensete ventricosum]|nr:hypothetical protein BHM03_00005085 [Ensete ventricosum]